MNVERLLNLAKALREAPVPQNFDMGRYVHTCGTPACAFGHYAARQDLQSVFGINTTADPLRYRHQGVYQVETGREITFDMECVLDHFGISPGQAEELFGCEDDFLEGDADYVSRLARTCKTPAEAADYIEAFTKRGQVS